MLMDILFAWINFEPLCFQIHGKDAVLSYDSDDESIDAENTSVASPPPNSNGPAHNNNNNTTSSHVTTAEQQHQPQQQQPQPQQQHPSQHQQSQLTSQQSQSSLTSLYHPPSHLNSSHPQYPSHYSNQMTASAVQHSMDFKPQYLADWYSHPYHTAMTAKPPTHHVTAALPTPPSTGHSPVQSLGGVGGGVMGSHHLPFA